MKYIDWNPQKNELFKAQRGISFEAVLDALLEDQLLDVLEHPNPAKYVHQKIMVVNVAKTLMELFIL